MNETLDFIIELKNKGIFIQEVNEQLKLIGNISFLAEDDKKKIKHLKSPLLYFLKNNGKLHKKSFNRIKHVANNNCYALSSSQKRLWLLSQFEEGNIAYNMPGVYVFEGELNFTALKNSFKTLIERHEILRTVFKEDEQGEIKQYIKTSQDIPFKIAYQDLRQEKKQEEKIKNLVEKEFITSFNLSSGPLLRATLYQVENNKWIFIYVMHHIISDGWSMEILFYELLLLYNTYSKGEENLLLPLSIQYKDYAAWQQEQLKGEQLKDHKKYWLQQLSGELPVLELPTDKARPAVKTYNGRTVNKTIHASLSKGLKTLSQEQGGTLFMGLLAAVNVLLHRYTNQEDIIIGSPIAGREHVDLENQIGFYVNALVLRTQCKGEDSFKELLQKVKQKTLEAYEHQLYPFDELVHELNLQRDLSRNALFDVMVVLQNTAINNRKKQQELDNLKVSNYRGAENLVSKFDLTFNFEEIGEELQVLVEYNSDIYSRSTIERLAGHLEQLLEAIIKNPEKPIHQLELLTPQEKHQLLVEFNSTTVDYPKDKTLIHLFEEQVEKTPDNIALVFEEKKLTYQELNATSNQLADYLRKNYKIKPDDLVAIKLERSEWMIIAILGVLKSGGAYVPIDPDYPEERINYMLADSKCKLVINEQKLEKFKQQQQKYKNKNLKFINKSTDLAYVIYTSGSTGKPKGVMIEHCTISNTIHCQQTIFDIKEDEKLLQFASSSFDASISEIFITLTSGATLYIISEDSKKNPELLEQYITENKIDIATIPPVYLKLIQVEKIQALKKLITAGEAAILDKANSFSNYGIYYNAYGPTESSICASIYKVKKGEKIQSNNVPIGKPIPNTQLYIVDNNYTSLMPIGAVGEICIGGDGLARGYLNKLELTTEKFIPNPFKQGERIYKTGDLGRWLADGNIEFIGRKDEQVKIRGYRIELGEIESALQSYQDIDSSVVVTKKNKSGEKELVAYVVSKQTLNTSDIRTYLSKSLPSYMLPSHYVQLEALPLTPNGKVDKKRLPDPEGLGMGSGVEYVAARNDIENHLIAVYEEVLKKPNIGIKEDFFVLGGDSIKSIQVVARLKQRGYSLTIQDILLHPIIEELAKYVKVGGRTIDQGIVEGIIPLNPIQTWFLQNNSTDKHHFNQSVLLYSKEIISEEGLRMVLDKIAFHHDGLRMIYHQTDAGWLQENKNKEQSYALEVIEASDEKTFIACCNRIQSSINLTTGPLFKAALFKSIEGDRLLLVAHHLIIDGVSWRILLEDLSNLYQQYLLELSLELPLKTDSFKYWQEKQIAYAKSETLQEEEAYWESTEAQKIIALPKDNPQGSNLMKDVTSLSFLLDESLTNLLLNQCYKAYRTEINDILITALSLALAKLFKLDKVLIKLEGHGREDMGTDIDVSRTIGWFTTIYPVVIDMSYKEDSIRQLIEVKENLHRVPNKGLGYGVLRYLAGKPYTLEPEISFNYLGDFSREVNTAEGNPLFEFCDTYQGKEVSGAIKRDTVLDIIGIVIEGKLRLSINYSKEQYSETTIERLKTFYKHNLIKLVNQLSSSDKEYLTSVDLSYKALTVKQVEELNKDFNVEDIYVLSPLQEGIYYHWLSDPNSTAYFEQMSYQVKGKVDIAALEKSYQALVSRYAILRTFFTQDFGEQVLQVVKKEADPIFKYLHINEDENFSIKNYKTSDRLKGFDLHKGSQMRLTVLGLNNNTYEFIWSFHHILMDGWCMSILIKEFFQIYQSLIQDRVPNLNTVYPYSTYIQWLSKIDQKGSLNYWKNYLIGYDTLSTIPKIAANKTESYQAKELIFFLNRTLRKSIKTLCEELTITENTFIQTLWSILLSKYNNTNDVVFGAVVSGRPAEIQGIEEMIGLFINTIPVRIQTKEKTTVKELLKDVQQSHIESTPHHYTQLASIQSQSQLGGNLFDHILIFENYPVQEMLQQNLQTEDNTEELELLSSQIFEQTNYDFTVTIIPADVLTIKFNYNGDLYDETFIQCLKSHLMQIIKEVLKNPSIAVHEIDYLSSEEKHQLLVKFNDTQAAYPKDKTLINLFEEQAVKTPDNIALVFEEKELTYEQLNTTSNQLGEYLRKNYKIKADDLIGIKLERNEWMIISILGVLKSGGAYVPIDPDYPQERITYMLEDSKCKVLIDEEELQKFKEQQENYKKKNLRLINKPTDLAYVIYTSGSTGKPKGCILEHQGVINRIEWMYQQYKFNSTDIILQKTTFTFDVSVWEIFMPLCWGTKMILCTKEDIVSPERILSLIEKQNISCLHFVPSMLNAFITTLFADEKINIKHSLKSLQKVITSGEALSVETVRNWYKQVNVPIYNLYGPTEASVDVTYYNTTSKDNHIPIGRPIWNTELYILGKENQLSPIGVIGEICIGGDGLARGYLNKPELTAEKFVSNPFKQGERMYKTGDLGRWLPDGNIEYIGRKDEQVKIRGYRIELGEIESSLHAHQDIDAAVVVAKTNKEGEKELVAYIVSKQPLNTSDIQAHLSKSLPSYMLPSHYVQLEALPLSSNGKIDRKKLPDPEELGMDSGIAYVAPRNETEEKLVLIWQEVLAQKKIGIKNSFFELGGDSIKALRMIGKLRNELNLQIPIADIYKNNTIESLAAHIVENENEIEQKNRTQREIEDQVKGEIGRLQERILLSETIPDKENIEDIYPMSDIEKGMVYESLRSEGWSAYHDQFVYQRTFSDFQIDRFRRALQLLVEKHSILRTSLHLGEYETELQIVHKNTEVSIPYKDLSDKTYPEQEREIRNFLKIELGKPFQFSQASLWRMHVFNYGRNEYGFIWQFHHSILDGWSVALLMTELNNLYLTLAENPLYQPEKLKSNYKDFIIQQEIDKKDTSIKDFWKAELTEYTRLDLFSEEEEFKTYTYSLDIHYLKKLEQRAVELNTTIKVLSLSAYLYMLKILTYGNEIVAGLVTNTRPNCEDGDKILGCFLNTIPLKMTIDGNQTCAEFIHQVNNKLIELKDYERASLMDIAQLHNENTGNPFFDVLFNYVDFHIYQEGEIATQNQENIESKKKLSLSRELANTYFDFTLDVTGGFYTISFQLSKKLKSEISLEKIKELYLNILNYMIELPNQSLNKLSCISAQEKHQLLVEFNDTAAVYPKDKTLINLFEEQVAKTPDNIVLIFEEKELNYEELNATSNQLGEYLRKNYKIKADDLIGIKLERSEWMIISILGVLKSGGAYVPIDPDYPEERIDYMLEDSKCKVLIDEQELEKFKAQQENYKKKNLKSINKPNDLAYVIYTSGSTGKPKGVMIEHCSITNTIHSIRTILDIKEYERGLQFASSSFDASISEIFPMLVSGGTLYIIKEDVKKNSELLGQYITENKIDIAIIPPAYLKLLRIEEIQTLKKLITAGEAAMLDKANSFSDYGMYYNAYGPTESSICASIYKIKKAEKIKSNNVPIGKPIPNTQLYIIGIEKQLLPVGVIGEICISGDGLARGYLNKPELTAEKFVPNPFKEGERMYKTGDLGRWLPDGNIEFIGRKDEQVKIRGYRIELGEIENVLQSYDPIDSAIVIAKSNKEREKELIAYIASRKELNTTDIRNYLSKSLPIYMFPTHYVQLEALPLTHNGKVDRKKLPDLEGLGMNSGVEYVTPRNEMEEKLVLIWQEILSKEKIGIKDNFFDLGGHSLKVMQLISKINITFLVQINIQSIFKEPTIESICEQINFILDQKKQKQNKNELVEIDI